jgi:phosphohistidine phosphatase
MLTLVLLRHAKSSWKSPTLADKDRPLSTRGESDAPLVGKAMAQRSIDPDLVLCSSARRTRDTLALVLPELKMEPKIFYDDALYHATASEMLEVLQGIEARIKTAMIVGHNPEIQALALDLIGHGPLHLRQRLAEKLPTCALVVINFQGPAWSDIRVNSGTLAYFITPRELVKA